jgi:hypothetical protein
MRAIKEETREYPQAALEDIFLYLDIIEKRYGVGDNTNDDIGTIAAGARSPEPDSYDG